MYGHFGWSLLLLSCRNTILMAPFPIRTVRLKCHIIFDIIQPLGFLLYFDPDKVIGTSGHDFARVKIKLEPKKKTVAIYSETREQ